MSSARVAWLFDIVITNTNRISDFLVGSHGLTVVQAERRGGKRTPSPEGE